MALPLTGELSEYGAAARNALNLAQENHTEKLTNVRFLLDDDAYDGKRTVASLTRFATIDEVDQYEFVLMVGQLFNDLTERPNAQTVISSFSRTSGKTDAFSKEYEYGEDSSDKFIDFPLTLKRVTGTKSVAIELN